MFTFAQNTVHIPSSAHWVTSQAMALCTICNGIPIHFFGPLPPDFSSLSDRFFHYHHHTLSALRQSAANGCPLCRILESQLKHYPLCQETKDEERLTMKRAIDDPEQAFGLWRDYDEISHNIFYHVPPDYRRLSYYHVIMTWALFAKFFRASTSQGPRRRES